MNLRQLSGAAAIALIAMMGSASAFTITTSTSTLVDFGTGTANSRQSQTSPFTVSGETFTFSGGAGTSCPTLGSGVYAGNISQCTASPFGAGDSTKNYLVAQPGGGGVTVSFGTTAQNAIEILWGTIDTASGYNSLLTTAGGETITGAQVCAAIGCSANSGAVNQEVLISGLASFTSYTATDTSTNPSAFEFVPGLSHPVPVPLIGHGLLVLLAVGGVLSGGKLAESLKNRRLHTA